MTPQQWQRIKTVFAGAAGLQGEARDHYLDAACGGDDDVRHEVESLLASNPPDGSHFLDGPAIQARVPVAPPLPHLIGRRIGPYELLGELGRGGMGEVYRARRADGQYEQEVAIKLIRSGYEERLFVLQRFKTERQILASLDHPNIARLLDGGATEDGSPYLVMELIEGTNLGEYCDAHTLNTASRLGLFRTVCSAVHFAHQRLIVHRDIKPANIIVTPDGTPKLMDFGIAKILAASSETEATANRPMTLAYASPEQIRGEPVTTASDVYSLGVVLYQLLSGRSPYQVDSRTPGSLYRAIDEQEPMRPSAAVTRATPIHGEQSQSEPTPASVSATREGSAARLVKRLSGDLDYIVLKALRKEPEQRYASAEQFSEDIERHLKGFPVLARQGTWTYHAGKFVRRHRGGMAATATVAIVTVAGVGATLVEARIAAANARRAQQRFEQVRKLANAMVFDVHDAIEPLPGTTKSRALIVRLGLEYLDQLANDPTVDASLQFQIASGYLRLGKTQGNPNESNLGDRVGAAASYHKAIDIFERLRVRDAQDREVTTGLCDALSQLARVTGSSAERWALQRRVLTLQQADAAAHPDDVKAQHGLAVAFFSAGLAYLEDARFAEASTPFRQALAIFEEIDRRAPTEDSARNVALCEKRLAALSLRSGDLNAALQGYSAALAIDERRVAKDPRSRQAATDLSYDLSDRGTTLRRLNRWDEAADAYNRAIAIRRDAYTADRNDVRARRALAAILYRQGNLLRANLGQSQAAVAPLREASRLWSVDDNEPQRGQAEYELGVIDRQMGNPGDAQVHLRLALAILEAAARAGPLENDQQAILSELRRNPGGAVPAAHAVR